MIRKSELSKEFRVITGLDLHETKKAVESVPIIREDASPQEADEIKEKLEAVGATIALK